MRRLPVVVVLLAASGWAQARSIERAGRITVSVGPRYVDKSYFAQRAGDAGLPLNQALPVGPWGVASFGYGAADWLEVTIDLFAGYDRFTIGTLAPFDSLTYGANLSVRASKLDVLIAGLSPYLGVGGGPAVVQVSSPGRPSTERPVPSVSVSAGATFKLTDTVGLSLDVRWLWARGMVPEISGVNAGGISASLGLAFIFPPEPKRDLSVPGF